ARGLLNYVHGDGKRHWSITPYTGFERFALDKFHGVETLTLLLTIISHLSNIWMMNVCSRARLAQKTRPRARILRHLPVDHLESDNRIQHWIANVVRYDHPPRTGL